MDPIYPGVGPHAQRGHRGGRGQPGQHPRLGPHGWQDNIQTREFTQVLVILLLLKLGSPIYYFPQ